MRPEEMRDDIPADVRSALARAMHGPGAWVNLQAELRDTLRSKPRTVHLPAADLPAPLEEVPEKGEVWTVSHAAIGVACLGSESSNAKHAVEFGLAFATLEDAEAWLAHMQSWNRPGADWTPHTPGDPMPCDGEAVVDIRLRNGQVLRGCPANHNGWQRLDDDYLHEFDITAWRYAREEDEE